MSSVLALKRNSTTVRYCFEADTEPGVLPRALELFAKRGLVPNRVFAQTADDALSVEIEVEGVSVRTLPLMTEPTLHDCRFPVDAVYTWVDGADPTWDAARRARLAQAHGVG